MELSKDIHSESLLPKQTSNSQAKSSLPPNAVVLKEDFQALCKSIESLAPTFIRTPFKGTCLQITKDHQSFVFGSREGRLGVCDISNKSLTKDINLEEGSIWTIDVTNDDAFVYSGGMGGKIRKWKLPELRQEEYLEGHKGEVHKIILSKNNQFLYSCGEDCKVKKWNLINSTEEQLYSHDAGVFGLDVTDDDSFLASCGEDGSVLVYSSLRSKVEFSKKIKNSPQHCVKISGDQKFLVSAGDNNAVYVWEFNNWDNFRVLTGHYDRITCMQISKDNRVLVTGSSDNLIKVWDLYGKQEEITLHGHSDWVKGLVIDSQKVHSMSDDCTIMTSPIPVFDSHYLLRSSSNSNSSIIREFHNSEKYFVARDNEVFLANGDTLTPFSKYKKGIFDLKLVKENTELIVFLKQSEKTEMKIRVINLPTGQKKKFVLKASSLVSSVEASEDGKFLITGESFRITIWDSVSLLPLHIIRSHVCDVTALGINESFLFAGDKNGVMKTYGLTLSYFELAHFSTSDLSSVSQICISQDRKFLVISTSSNQVQIWSTQTKTCLKEIQQKSPVNNIRLTKDSSQLFFSHGPVLEIWNMDNFSKCGEMVTKDHIQSISLIKGDKAVVLAFSEYLKVIESPFVSDKFSLYGHYENGSKFVAYVQKIIRGEIPKYDESMNNWLIEPYHMNVLHLYAFFNLTKHLTRAIKAGCAFFPSRFGYTALTISVDKKLQDCIDCIFETFKSQAEQDPFIFYYFSNTLAALNKSGYPKLHQFYQMVFQKTVTPYLPKFCESGVSLPIRKYSKDIFVNKEKFMSGNKYQSKDTAIEFYQSFVRLPTQLGSRESLDFLRSLIECKNIEVFSSSIIRKLLESKWKSVRVIFAVEGFLYFAYLIMLILYTIFSSYRDNYELIAPMSINCILFLNELLQMAYSGLKYFSSFWNYIDLTRFSLFTAFFIIKFEDKYHESQSNLLLACIFFSLLRGTSYFRINSTTRWVINLIFEVLYQLWALILVTLYALLALVVIFGYFSKEGFSEFLSENQTVAQYEFFLIFAVLIINPIIMLNLFIAIVGDSFEKSQDDKSVKNGQDLAEMIYEAELLLFCNRKLKGLKFVHEVREEHGEIVSSTAGQRIKIICGNVEGLNEKSQKNKEKLAELTKFVENSLEQINDKTKEILKRSKIGK